MALSRRHLAWARRRGGVEYGRRHYPGFVAVQVLLLAGAPLEAWLLHRPFIPALGWPMLTAAVLAQGLRWWCIGSLRERWNTRVVTVPGLPLVDRGPYRFLRHPNYVAVIAEGVALPLVHTAWLTASVFTVANLGMLAVRLRVENAALDQASPAGAVSGPR
ncbi:isoprenylcysteine carboxyl methyltransferase family protein [Actinomadura violacea]|uniref:isoprenylcysteine carboxyl methyltransferase family protein n=1 Tax=Actinomadura violacea TaxID=2819934 RepID=UPI0027DD76C1|nr:isoprenylcysteine carboxylmethyltransferase family protein [Actinomadura violacea]